MKEQFFGPRGRLLEVPPELAESWAHQKPKPSRSQRENEVFRHFMEVQARETIQLHILLTAMTMKFAGRERAVSFSIAELTALGDLKRLVAVSASDKLGEVRVKLPDEPEPLIIAPGGIDLPPPPGAA